MNSISQPAARLVSLLMDLLHTDELQMGEVSRPMMQSIGSVTLATFEG